jgi:hypothetical protein
MCLSPKEVIFKKPEASSQHLKSLYIRVHINGKLISRMLISDGAAINLMLNARGGQPDGGQRRCIHGANHREQIARYMFFIEVQSNYSVILGHDWIHVNHCVSSTLHQFLI